MSLNILGTRFTPEVEGGAAVMRLVGGFLRDADGSPLAGIAVQIKGLENGYYLFTRLPLDTFSLSAGGFGSEGCEGNEFATLTHPDFVWKEVVMKDLVLGLLLLGVYFCLPLLFPAKKAWIAWPHGKNSKSWLPFIQRLPASCASMGAAAPAILPLLGAVVGLFWNTIMPTIWPALVVCGAGVSALLYSLYFNRYAILPLLVDAVLLWGTLGAGWTNWSLNGW